METPVYGTAARWTAVLMVVWFAPIIALLLWLRSVDRRDSGEFLMISGILTLFFIGLFLLIHLTTNVWIRIDRPGGKVVQLYRLFKWPVYRRIYDLSAFDRISLHRAYRGGYRAALVGRDREVPVGASWKLGLVRQGAERVAAFTGLKMNDQL